MENLHATLSHLIAEKGFHWSVARVELLVEKEIEVLPERVVPMAFTHSSDVLPLSYRRLETRSADPGYRIH